MTVILFMVAIDPSIQPSFTVVVVVEQSIQRVA